MTASGGKNRASAVSFDLISRIIEDYQLPLDGVHALDHWARVLENGRRIAAATRANLAVVELFAVFHDSQRLTEGTDPEHGRRGAEYARAQRGRLFDLPDPDFELLYTACERHTDGLTEADVTVQACWDSDRLDLGRVGADPLPALLCTPASRSPDLLAWATQRGRERVLPVPILVEWGLLRLDPGDHA